MQATIASKCFRAQQLIFRRSETMIINSSNRFSCHQNPIPSRLHSFTTSNSLRLPFSGEKTHRNFIFTRKLSTSCKPWQVSRTNPNFFKHLNAFVADFSPTPPQKPVSLLFFLSMTLMCVCVCIYMYESFSTDIVI